MGQDIKEHHNLNTHHPGKCLGDFYNPREATTWIELPQHWCQHSWQLNICKDSTFWRRQGPSPPSQLVNFSSQSDNSLYRGWNFKLLVSLDSLNLTLLDNWDTD